MKNDREIDSEKDKIYNKFIAAMRQFISWLNNDKDYSIKNPFVGVTRRSELIDKTIVSKSEFHKLIDCIDPEKGYKTYPSGEKKISIVLVEVSLQTCS